MVHRENAMEFQVRFSQLKASEQALEYILLCSIF